MRVFLTGATSFVGRALIPELQAHGHSILGLARTDAGRDLLRAMDVDIYSGQGHNTGRLGGVLCEMDVMVHLATMLPRDNSAIEDGWVFNRQIVVGMLRNLLVASEACGIQKVIFPSFYGIYGDHQKNIVTEASLPAASDVVSQSYLEAEKMLLRANAEKKVVGVVVRMGQLYGEDSIETKGLIYALGRSQAPIFGSGEVYWPLLHVKDAARGLNLAIEKAKGGEIYNLCDDEPVQQRKLYTDIAGWLGVPPPAHQGTAELRPYMGQINAPQLRYSVRMSNRKIREKLGFVPEYPDHRKGYMAVIRKIAEQVRRSRKKAQS